MNKPSENTKAMFQHLLMFRFEMPDINFWLALGICCFVVLLAAGAAFYFLRSTLTTFLEKSLGWRLGIAGLEVVLALALTAVANLFDLFKTDTWRDAKHVWKVPGNEIAGAYAALLLIVILYAGVKILLTLTKEKDQKTIANLKEKITQIEHDGASEQEASANMLAEANTKIELVTKQRDWAAGVRQLIGQIVAEKGDRLVKAWKSPRSDIFGLSHFVEALDSKRQILVILTTLHEVFFRLLNQGQKLRLGVYLKEDGHMRPIYSFDGKNYDCFGTASGSYMEIDDPEGAKSLITKLYHSPETCFIVADCVQAMRSGEFYFFRHEQLEYLKSLVAVKRKTVHTGEKNIIILTMDTDQADFFGQIGKERIELYCAEILKRLEFELLCFNIKSSIA